MFAVLHGASASAGVSEPRAGSVSDRPLMASTRAGAYEKDVREGLLSLTYAGISTCNQDLPNFKLEAVFMLWLLCQNDTSIAFSLSARRAGVLLPFVLALSRIWHRDWICHPSFCTLGLVNSGLIKAL